MARNKKTDATVNTTVENKVEASRIIDATPDVAPETMSEAMSEAAPEDAPVPKFDEKAFMTLHDLLAYAHDTLGNRKALSEQDFEDHGVSNQVYTQWVAYVEELRKTVIEYINLSEDKNATDQDIENSLGHVFVAWRTVLKNGTESEFNKNFFIRKNDADIIANWAGRGTTLTAKGRVYSPKSKTDFRRNVETHIGIRMAGNRVLSDDNRDLIVAYEGAERTIKNMSAKLNDIVSNGKTTSGLRSQLIVMEHDIEARKKEYADANISEDLQAKWLEKDRNALTNLKSQITDAEKKLTKAQEYVDAHKKDYDFLMALIKSVGGDDSLS